MAILATVAVLGFFLFTSGEWSRHPRFIPRTEVWEVVEREAAKHELDPAFVFAIVAAESSFNARARNGDARGLMQVRRIAWKTVSDEPHRLAWRWRENIAAGTAYLGHLKQFLEEHGQFSYPMLAACYRHGPYRVKEVGFALDRLPVPKNRIYLALHRGEVPPVEGDL